MVRGWEMAFYYSLRIYNPHREDGVPIIILEALDASKLLSTTVFFALPGIATMSQASYANQGTDSAPFAVCICVVWFLPRSNPLHASPASKFMLSFISQISSSVDGLRPWSSEKRPCQVP